MKLPVKMKAAVLKSYGSTDVIDYTELPVPITKDNEVLVKVQVASATRADTMMRTGKPYFGRIFLGIRKPKNPIPGTGFSGEIVKIGKSVSHWKVGDLVFGETTTHFSTNAQYVAVPAHGVMLLKPDNLSHSEAASYCDGHLTSLNFLKNVLNTKPGQKILVNGASGSLGTSAIQIAKALGAEVTGVCSNRNTGLVRDLGADFVIDYTREDFTKSGRKYDHIYDTVGKIPFGKAKKALAKNGIYASPVLSLSLLVQMMYSSIFTKKKAFFEATGMKKSNDLRAMLQELVMIFKNGNLKTVIDRQFSLESVAQAHAYIETGHKKGNVIIQIDHNK